MIFLTAQACLMGTVRANKIGRLMNVPFVTGDEALDKKVYCRGRLRMALSALKGTEVLVA